MILTITLNPSIDISVAVGALIPEDKLRCERYEKEVGGGGINVAKGLSRLGLDGYAMFFSSGKNGQWINERLKEAKLKTIPIMTHGETRENINITDHAKQLEYRLINKGNRINKKEEAHLMEMILKLNPTPEFVIVSGSSPDGIHHRFYKNLAIWCKKVNANLVLDIPADQLKTCLKYQPFLIKPNLKEFLQLIGKTKLSKSGIIEVAKSMIRKKKATYIAISMGSKGGMLVSAQEAIQLKAPESVPLSTVGAGDSMVAGMTYQFASNANLKDVLRLGLACGTAATMKKGTKLFDAKTAWKLFISIK